MARIAGVVLLVGGALVVASPLNASIAIRRLLNPLSGPSWPKRTTLDITDLPTKLAKGDPFELEVSAKGLVPSRVDIQYRFNQAEYSGYERLRQVVKASLSVDLIALIVPLISASWVVTMKALGITLMWSKLLICRP